MAIRRPDRVMDPYADQFWAYTSREQLRLQRCDACGAMRWPPAAVCDRCLSAEYAWIAVAGRGRLVSWVTFRRQYFPEYPPPHRAIVVELEEGPLFVSALAEQGEADLREGMEMEVAWEASEDSHGTYMLPLFRPVPALP